MLAKLSTVVKKLAGDIDRVRSSVALQGVNGEVEKDLEEVGAVDLWCEVLGWLQSSI